MLSILILTTRLMTPTWRNINWLSPISWDVFGYYLYLPATFIYHDLGIKNFSWVQHILNQYSPTIGFYQAYMGPAGDYVMKYPIGLSILYSPLFLIGHFFAYTLGYQADGFSLPYQIAISIGSVIYTWIGLWYFRKVLLRFFSDPVAAVTLLIIVLGTNFFELTTLDNAMPHNYLFTIFAIILYLTIKWHENPHFKYAIPLGILCGLAILIRPTSGIIIIVPLLWDLWSKKGVLKKINLIRNYYGQVLCMMSLIAMVVGIQLLYWKIHAGSWLYYSYEKGEELVWIAPYLSEVLFSYKKGWLVYTPVMSFALIGFLLMAYQWAFHKNRLKPDNSLEPTTRIFIWRNTFLPFFLFFIFHLIIVASWPTWWYGGSFGQRTMLESYVILAIPMGIFISYLFEWNKIFRLPLIIIIIFLVILNLFQTWQYFNIIIDPYRMTKPYYWKIFGKNSVTHQDKFYLEPLEKADDREGLPKSDHFSATVLAYYNFENADPSNVSAFCTDTVHTGKFSMRLNRRNEYSPGISIPYNQLSQQDFAWVQACGYVYFTCKPEETGIALVITCMKKGIAYKYRLISLDKENLKPNEWNQVCMDYMIPYLEDPSDIVQAYFWCRGNQEALVDDIEIKLFEFP